MERAARVGRTRRELRFATEPRDISAVQKEAQLEISKANTIFRDSQEFSSIKAC